MKVLVTGHKGYIGVVLVPMLKKEGYEVVGLDSDLYQGCTFGKEPAEIPSVDKDLRDVEAKDLKGIGAVMHLAGLSNDPLGDLNEELTYDINYRASVRLAKLCKEAGVERYIFSSSCSNYGAAGNAPLEETAGFNPVTAYGKSKVKVEQEVATLADNRFTPVFLRNATAYGVSSRLRFDLVLNNLVAWAFTTGSVRMKSDGEPWRPIVHIEDISAAFIAVLKAPKELVHNEAFNVGATEENYQIKTIARIVEETVPNSKVEFAKEAGPDKRNYRVNCSKIQRVLGFRTKWTARQGAEQLYKAYKELGITLQDFEGDRYCRIAHIKMLLKKGSLDNSLRWKE